MPVRGPRQHQQCDDGQDCRSDADGTLYTEPNMEGFKGVVGLGAGRNI